MRGLRSLRGGEARRAARLGGSLRAHTAGSVSVAATPSGRCALGAAAQRPGGRPRSPYSSLLLPALRLGPLLAMIRPAPPPPHPPHPTHPRTPAPTSILTPLPPPALSTDRCGQRRHGALPPRRACGLQVRSQLPACLPALPACLHAFLRLPACACLPVCTGACLHAWMRETWLHNLTLPRPSAPAPCSPSCVLLRRRWVVTQKHVHRAPLHHAGKQGAGAAGGCDWVPDTMDTYQYTHM